MKQPKLILNASGVALYNREEIKYVTYINSLILKLTRNKGKKGYNSALRGKTYKYFFDKNGLSARYIKKELDTFTSEEFILLIDKEIFNNIPKDKESLINIEGFNYVYNYVNQNNNPLITRYIPGDWLEILKDESKNKQTT